MKIGMICFTARGTAICRLLCRRFRDTGTECTGYVPQRFWKPEWEAEGIKPQDKSLSEWTGSREGGIFLRFGVPQGGGRVWSRNHKKREFRQRSRERWGWY